MREMYETRGYTVNALSFDVAQASELWTALQSKPKTSIVIGPGVHNIPVLLSLAQQRAQLPDLQLIWSGHQITPALLEAAPSLNTIVLPTHAVSFKDESKLKAAGTQLVKTIGVPHNTTPEDLERERAKWQSEEAEGDKPNILYYTMVVLAGDAPTPEGEMRYFTPDEARALATEVASRFLLNLTFMSGGVILATNGPRTGKYDPATGKELLTHHELHPQTKEPLDYKLDAVSAAFIEELKVWPLKEGVDFKFFDFKFGAQGVVSAYQALLGTIAPKRPNVICDVFMPGESTSMISEACDLKGNAILTVYTNGAMNALHDAHVQELRDSGIAKVLEPKPVTLRNYFESVMKRLVQMEESKPTTHIEAPSSYQPAARCVAEAVGKRLGIISDEADVARAPKKQAPGIQASNKPGFPKNHFTKGKE